MNTFLICLGYLTLSTLIGVFAGLFAKSSYSKANSLILAFSAGIMMYTSFNSLILPHVSVKSTFAFIAAAIGFALGVIFISTIGSAPAFLKRLLAKDGCDEKLAGVLLFVTAVAVHKIPEGIASGLTCADTGAHAYSLSLGLAVQNIPDGFILSAPLVMAGMARYKAFLFGSAAAVLSALGSVLGFVGASLLSSLLEGLLAFAGGMMIYVTVSLLGESESKKGVCLSFALGVVLMMFFERYV